jgi:tetratricopeptide (TPR) repeat protein
VGPDKLLNDLREDLSAGRVLVIAGTGISIQATGGAPAARWDGLIRSGIEHCVGIKRLTEAAAQPLREQLAAENVEARLTVAENVSEILGAPRGGEFRRWLGESMGRLELKDRAIVDAVHGLGAPIATTNYDDLLTRGRGIAHVPWTEGAAAHELVRGDREAVLHLHGCFDHPESVILGVRSYQKLLDSRGAQAIQQALVAHRTLLFIGCGDGLSDPNFGALLEWSAAAFGGSIYRHYCLCLAGERDALQKRRPADDRLFYVEYGSRYEDLVPFLRDLAPHKTLVTLPNPGYCFGREREVEEVVAALLADNPQPLPILGGPGMGKTTIALKALHDRRVAERFRERRWFVRCDGVKTRAELAAAIAGALNLPTTPNVEQAVLAALAAASGALVLDNGETPLDADGGQVEELLSILATLPSLALVVTIRGHKRPAGVPWGATTEPERLTDSAAAEAFVAASGKPHFAHDPDLPRLLVVLDGVPLAVTLMAHFAEMFDTLEPVWSRWEKKRTAVYKDGEARDRLKNLAVSYELSVDVLGDAARRLLSVLAMLPDGVALRDLEGVFADPDDAADELRRRALVFEEGQRVRMRAPLREYVAVAHPPDTDDERRVVDHYLGLAASEGEKLGRAGGAEAVARLAPEVANVEAMLGKGGRVLDDVLVRAVYGWAGLMRFTGLGSTGPIEQIAANAITDARTNVAARSFKSLGDIALRRSDHETARRWYEEAQPLYRQLGHVQGEANCIRSLGNIALRRSDHETARGRYEEALPLYRQVGDVQGEANCIKRLGNIALERSDHETAQRRYEEALPLYRQVGAVLGEANCIKSLGDIALRRSDPETARRRYEEALPLYRQVGTVLGEANCIQGFGDISVAEGARDEAESKYREALALYERIGEPYSVGGAHLRLARLATEDASRTAHVTAAREAWLSVGREDLVEKWLAEFDEEKA